MPERRMPLRACRLGVLLRQERDLQLVPRRGFLDVTVASHYAASAEGSEPSRWTPTPTPTPTRSPPQRAFVEPAGWGPSLWFHHEAERKMAKNQMQCDLPAPGGSPRVRRLERLGAMSCGTATHNGPEGNGSASRDRRAKASENRFCMLMHRRRASYTAAWMFRCATASPMRKSR
jgi:hypothetical protein